MIGYIISGFTIQDIIKPGLGTSFIGQSFIGLKWVCNMPARIGINENKFLILSGNLIGITIPFKVSLIKNIDILNKRDFEIYAGCGHRIAYRSAKLCDDYLLLFIDYIYARCD